MIILASDQIGYKVVEYFIEKNEPISALVLDTKNRGNFNKKIIEKYQSKFKNNEIYYETDLKDNETLERLQDVKSVYGILAWWPYIIKEKLLSIPKKGWINFHPSYLPFNKGKHSSFWCLVDETQCGVSLQIIDEGIDTGDIIARKKINASWEDNGEILYNKCRDETFELFKENFNDIKNDKIKCTKQIPSEGTYHHSSELSKIINLDLESSYELKKLLNILRGKIKPYAYFYDNDKKFSVEIIIKEEKD
jgi:methionyl-tRNA formyltransferase